MNKNIKKLGLLIFALLVQVLDLNGLTSDALKNIPDSAELIQKKPQARSVAKKGGSSKRASGKASKRPTKKIQKRSTKKMQTKRGGGKAKGGKKAHTSRRGSVVPVEAAVVSDSFDALSIKGVENISGEILKRNVEIKKSLEEAKELKKNKKTESKAAALEVNAKKLEDERKELEKAIAEEIKKEINNTNDVSELNKKRDEFANFIKSIYTQKEFLGDYLTSLNTSIENRKKDLVLETAKQGYFDYSELDEEYRKIFKMDNDSLKSYKKENNSKSEKTEQIKFSDALMKFREDIGKIVLDKSFNYNKYKKEVQKLISENFTSSVKGKIKINEKVDKENKTELENKFIREFNIYKQNQEIKATDDIIKAKTKQDLLVAAKIARLDDYSNAEKYLKIKENKLDSIYKEIVATNKTIDDLKEASGDYSAETKKLDYLKNLYKEKLLFEKLNGIKEFTDAKIKEYIKNINDIEIKKIDSELAEALKDKNKINEDSLKAKKVVFEEVVKILEKLEDSGTFYLEKALKAIKALLNDDDLEEIKKQLSALFKLFDTAIEKDYKYIASVFYSSPFFRNIITDLKKHFDTLVAKEDKAKRNVKGDKYNNLIQASNFLDRLLDIKTKKEFTDLTTHKLANNFLGKDAGKDRAHAYVKSLKTPDRKYDIKQLQGENDLDYDARKKKIEAKWKKSSDDRENKRKNKVFDDLVDELAKTVDDFKNNKITKLELNDVIDATTKNPINNADKDILLYYYFGIYTELGKTTAIEQAGLISIKDSIDKILIDIKADTIKYKLTLDQTDYKINNGSAEVTIGNEAKVKEVLDLKVPNYTLKV